MRQHEITRSRPLLDSRGNIAEPGFAKSLLPVYRRADVQAPAYRIKEWDYYLINNGRCAVALTVADNGYMGMDSISFLDFENHWQQTLSPMCAFPMGRRKMPESSARATLRCPARATSWLSATRVRAGCSSSGWRASPAAAPSRGASS